MTFDEARFLFTSLAGLGLGVVVAVAIAWVILKSFIPGYLAEKGKNLATKEDVAEITRKVEDVKHQYTQLVEAQRATQQLRMAAMDRRLQAHQDAFALWAKLLAAANVRNEQRVEEIGAEIEVWWNQNCLYLEVGARGAIRTLYPRAYGHLAWMRGEKVFASSEVWQANYSSMERVGSEILEAAQLPTLSAEELPKFAVQ